MAADHRARADLTAELSPLLRRCVQCGLCLPHCATWAVTGNEVHSPRGRLVLLGDLLAAPPDARGDAAAAYAEAFDCCIGCRACEAACPSGVPFSLLSAGQEMTRGALAPAKPLVPGAVLARLDSPAWLRFLAAATSLARAVLRGLWGRRWRQRLGEDSLLGRPARLVGTLPRGPGRDAELLRLLDDLCGRAPAERARPGAWPRATPVRDVAVFAGCANEGLLPDTSRRLRELLAATGCRVTVPAGQACCGALSAHAGSPERAAQLAATNRAALDDVPGGTPLVVEAAGCGLALREYDPPLERPVIDAVAFLARGPLPPLGRVPLRVAVHDPCHARHGQGVVAEPRTLLASIPGVEVVEAPEPEVCCGSGGAWGLSHPEMSAAAGRRKAAQLAGTGADVIVTSNPGCLGQIADGLAGVAPPGREPPPILPLTDLLWYAAQCARA